MACFKAVKVSEAGISGGGRQKWCARAVSSGVYTLEDLTTIIEKRCTVNGADICAVLYALADVSAEVLEKGNIVRFGNLGSMRLKIKSECSDTETEVTASVIKKSHVVFSPGRRLKEVLARMTYTKV